MCAYRVLQPPSNLTSRWPWNAWAIPRSRWFAHRAFDATLDPEQLAEARKWHQSFQLSSLPEGNTSYSRSSGPGGQHVNKSRSANADENRRKLFEEIQELYRKTVPGESSPETTKKYEELKKSANEARLKAKKMQKSKKASRRGFDD
ncbi:hypothetical protein VTH82DRAFT_6431 [Thermothelomyces myriococcoides]